MDASTALEGDPRVPSDEDLLRAAHAGDRDSFGLLVRRWERPLYRFTFRLLGRREEARDACQETFVRVLAKAHRFRDSGRFSTWMYQIALNLCRDHRRKRRRWGALVLEGLMDPAPGEPALDPPSPSPGADVEVERLERREAVTAALESLPPDQREVLVMKEYEGMKFREIAAILGCPESTVKSRMYYGLRALRSALVRGGFGRPDGGRGDGPTE